jgi:hypothetical protein
MSAGSGNRQGSLAQRACRGSDGRRRVAATGSDPGRSARRRSRTVLRHQNRCSLLLTAIGAMVPARPESQRRVPAASGARKGQELRAVTAATSAIGACPSRRRGPQGRSGSTLSKPGAGRWEMRDSAGRCFQPRSAAGRRIKCTVAPGAPSGIEPSPLSHKNNFDLLRFVFAFTVLLPQATRCRERPRSTSLRFLSAELAIQGFFVVSGYLVFASLENSRSVGVFFEKRPAHLPLLRGRCGCALSAFSCPPCPLPDASPPTYCGTLRRTWCS